MCPCGSMPFVETSFPGFLDADTVGSLDAQTGYGAAESRWSNVCGGVPTVAHRTRRLARQTSIGNPLSHALSTGMDRALVQQLVRRKINDRRLPRGRAVAIREMLGDGRPCNACGEPISPREKFVLAMVSLDWRSVRFHGDCYEVWDAERLREEG